MKKYPFIHEYTEAILNPEGRFRKLSGVEPVSSPGTSVSYTLSQNRVNFRISSLGKEYILSCRLAPSPADDREEYYIKAIADIDSPYLMGCEYLREEIYVFDSSGNGSYYDVTATEYPAGVPLYSYMAKLSSGGNAHECEKFLYKFLAFASRMAIGKRFSHNNLKPKNVFVCNDGAIRLTDYRLLTVPGGELHANDSEFLSVTALAAYALTIAPEVFGGCREEFFSDIAAVKNAVMPLYAGSTGLFLSRILRTAEGKYRTGEKELAEAFEKLPEEEKPKIEHPAIAVATPHKPGYEFEGKLHEGLSCVVSEGKYGYAAKDGNIIIPAMYDWAGDFEEGLALVRKDGAMGLIDKRGKEILPLQYEDISWVADNGVILACVDGKWRFFDREGNAVSRLVFDNVGDFSEGLAWVLKDGKYGFADRNGRVVIPTVYDDATSFNNEGYASVQIGRRRHVIDTKGEII